MAKQLPHDTFINRKMSLQSIVIICVVVFIISVMFGGLIALGLHTVTNNIIASSGVTVSVNVLGDDVIVEIVGGERKDELKCLILEIGKYEFSDAEVTMLVTKDQTKYCFEGIASKVRGEQVVAVTGIFTDNLNHLISSKKMRFS